MPEPAVTTRDDAPRWTLRFVGAVEAPNEFVQDGATVSVVEGSRAARVSVRIPHAVALAADELQEATVGAFATIRRTLAKRPELRPFRMWNFIPGILAPLGPFRHRYMAFNAGRFRAFQDWQGGSGDLSAWVPTSSGVGNPGPDLVVHALASDNPGTPIENSRQIPAYRYSSRYGPRPPCFARGVRLSSNGSGSAVLIIGGTASVVGEHTRHAGDFIAQIDETLANVVALIRNGLPEAEMSGPGRDLLTCMRQLIVYYVRAEDRSSIEGLLRTRLGQVYEIDYVHTALCRPDLLVEIEGIASVAPIPELC